MHWFAFAILFYIVLVLQTTIAPFLSIHTVRPDFVIILATHYAMMARPLDAVLSCWIIGLGIDLCGISYTNYSNVGISAFTLGLIAMMVIKMRELTVRDSAFAQLLLTFCVKISYSVLIGFHMNYVLNRWSRMSDVVVYSFWAAAYTAILAPYGHWMMRKMRGTLGLSISRLPDVR